MFKRDSNLTSHGLICRIEIDYDMYPLSRAEVARGIARHALDVYSVHKREEGREVLVYVFDEGTQEKGAIYAWPDVWIEEYARRGGRN